MSWVAIVLWILAHAGDLIALVQAIISLINSIPHGEKRQEVSLQARQEIAAAIRGNSREGLKGVLEKWKANCEGVVGCPAALKGLD